MSRDGNRANTPAGAQISGLLLLSIGLYGIVLGEAFQLLLELGLWPGALTNDAFMAPLFLSLGLIFVASILVLAGLCCLKVHWLVALGTFLLALLVAYVQGQLFPTNPASYSLYWFLTYGGIVVILSFLSLAPVKGVWPLLWRMLLVTGAGAGITLAFFVARGSNDWIFFPGGFDVMLVTIIVGALIPIVGYRFAATGRERTLSN